MNYPLGDTIIALATPAGAGSISVIRISGENCFEVTDTVFKGKAVLIKNCPSHTIHYGNILTKNDEVIDDVLVSIFKKPNSYTGEDVIEISSHGNQYIVNRVIQRFLEENIRLAEPGEFTKRAFLNGKMDLAQAEAVADIIAARTEASLKGARNQFDGILSSKIEILRNQLLEISSLLELELDFAEEEIELLPLQNVKIKIEDAISEIDSLLKTYSFGKIIRDGVNVALVGRPNVGKSSLLNYFLKEARAIVSDIPGTTRDIIREELVIDGILFRISDTAGLRSTDDAVEKEGVLRSKDEIRNADIVILMSDINNADDKSIVNELLELTDKNRIIHIINKIDLIPNSLFDKDIAVSVKKGIGIDKLLQSLKEKVLVANTFTEKSAVVSNLRHYNSLIRTNEGLTAALESVKNNMSEEYIAADLRNAVSSLGEIIGKVTSEDILNNIFSKFCIGK